MDEQRIGSTQFQVAPKLLGMIRRKHSSAAFSLQQKYLEKRKEIVGYQQEDGTNLYDAWERYKLLLKCCPRHKFSKMEITLTFTDGQKPTTCMFLDASNEKAYPIVVLSI